MKCNYSKKQLEELYNCEIYKQWWHDGDSPFMWVAHGEPIDTNIDDSTLFKLASGYTLQELHEDIRAQILEKILKLQKESLEEDNHV